jgi:hypothetical protein
MLSPFASLRVNCAKHLLYHLEYIQMQILRSAQDDSRRLGQSEALRTVES